MSTFKINIHEAIFFLSDALNLVSDNQINHSKRVAYMAAECAKALDWESGWIDDLFLASLLHDCGISNASITERIDGFTWETVENHCSRGAQLLNDSPPLAHLSEFILYHHTNWEDIIPIDIWEKSKISANCIYMIDTIDLYLFKHLSNDSNILASKEKIRKIIRTNRITKFNHQLVDIFLAISEPEAFWLGLNKCENAGYAKHWIEHDSRQTINFTDLKSIVLIFSRMVDAKSYYTKNHSEGVGSLSRCLGELFHLTEQTCDKLELAGLIHDLGKLRVSDKILNKAGDLTESEFFIMQRHSYDTYEITKNIKGFDDFSIWASQHHERLDGSGYPYRYTNKELSLEARIIAIADVFQGLSQNRPYRKKLTATNILVFLKRQMEKGKLDKDIILMIESNLEKCWKAASSNANKGVKI